jgi:hypothetical protein
METTAKSHTIIRRHVALPSDHGAWVFLFSPLIIGGFAAGRWSPAILYVFIAALAAFLFRQPAMMAVKVYTGRRGRRDLPAAWFWMAAYGLVACLAFAGLIVQGFSYLFILALPGLPVFAWHLYLVSRRAERRQMGVEIVGSGVFALAAPAAYWVSLGRPDPVGWGLFALVWLQSAASIVHAYMRLEQRGLDTQLDWITRLKIGSRALSYTTFNLILVFVLSQMNFTPAWLFLPYAVQWLETLWGTWRPAHGVRPTRIGIRQLIVSTLFTILFVLAWRIGS